MARVQEAQPGRPRGLSSVGTAALVAALLLFIYSLTYSGTFSTDDEHILASRALSLAFEGRGGDLRVLGNSRVFALSQLPGAQAAQALNIEPGQGIAGAVLARASLILGTGRVQTLFLLNIWVGALTAAIVVLAGESLGCSRRVSAAGGLALGLGTQVWPYTQTLFRDPLAMLFLAAAWWKALQITAADASPRCTKQRWLEMLAALLLGILTKNTVVLALPALAALLFLRRAPRPRDGQRPAHRKWMAVVALAALLGAAGLAVILAGRLEPLARFSLPYYWDLLQHFLSSPHPALAQAVLGPLVSPGKSIFLYSPILLLGLVGLRQDWRLALPAWAYLVLLALGQGLFYGADWPGHVNWGLRFVLPAVPPLVISSVPVIDGWLQDRSGRRLLLALGMIAVGVQLLGLLAPLRPYYAEMMRLGAPASAAGIWDLRYSPILWQLRWLIAGSDWNLAAARIGGTAALAAAALFLPALAAGLLGIRAGRSGWASACLAAALAATLCLPGLFSGDPVYSPKRSDLLGARAVVVGDGRPGDLLAVNAYGTPAWQFWMNWGPPQPEWTSLPFAGLLRPGLQPDGAIDDPHMDQLAQLLTERLQAGGRVWLLLPCDSASSQAGLDLLLEGQGVAVGRRTFQDGDCTTALLLLSRPAR